MRIKVLISTLLLLPTFAFGQSSPSNNSLGCNEEDPFPTHQKAYFVLPTQNPPSIFPPNCSSVRNSAGYRSGWLKGLNLAIARWEYFERDCNQVNNFKGVFYNDIYMMMAGIIRPSEYEICRFSGIVDSWATRFSESISQCHVSCNTAATFISTMYAQAYCQLVASPVDLIDYFNPPRIFDSEIYSLACNRRFISIAEVYIDSDWRDCYLYTAGSYQTNFDNFRDHVCQ